ncbi:aminotransferase class I/II-fold pyridoxal phosphate-dependent enzyme [Alkalihalobacillus pseudalcaliphilus]|uniref:aminotransferase class I/II-fold pyridoxal phosphate-dependent enzyme n=1 Tax=Alkalihalobacillus pseudalcaliphilus TaxID=79884 RepID=UPI000A9499E0|nr:aminotransferase class I/II-fold pyridoxal phosphate-dependent enzyme [Alkalihalobacillus pseudalcaliphilus]
MSTPIIDYLKRFHYRKPVSFHVPGHKNGACYPEGLIEFKSVLSFDVTELDGLDDLHDPTGIILESQQLLADYYKAKKSYYLVNGSTVGNLAMIYASFQKGDYVFVQRNCHKSVLNGLSLREAIPVFLEPCYDEQTGQAIGLEPNIVKEAYQKYPHAKGILITYPNYYGVSLPVKEVIAEAKRCNLKVLVDEAHGVHFQVGEPFPPPALSLGADIVVQSAHKMLPALTMSAYLHISESINDDEVEVLEQALAMLQSSSPSYLLLASLEGARDFMENINEEVLQSIVHSVEQFKLELQLIPQIEVVEYDDTLLQIDPLKVTIKTRTALSGYELQRIFSKFDLETELADEFHVLFVCGFVQMPEKVSRQLQLIRDYLHTYTIQERVVPRVNKQQENISVLTIHQVSRFTQIERSRAEAVGEIAAEAVIPYPPGVPLVYPGERIRAEVINQIERLSQAGARFQGYQAKKGKILTIDVEEDQC